MSWVIRGPWIDGGKDTEWKWKIEDGVLHIAFEGSTSRLDWLQNFSFWMKPYKHMPVVWFAHKGICEKWKAVENDVLKVVAENNLPVKLHGFSQGGGVAVLCHESIAFHFPSRDVTTDTYGAPRVVWIWAWNKIKHRFTGITHYQHRWDIVTHVPPWILGYLHAGEKEKHGSAWPSLRFKHNHMSYWR